MPTRRPAIFQRKGRSKNLLGRKLYNATKSKRIQDKEAAWEE